MVGDRSSCYPITSSFLLPVLCYWICCLWASNFYNEIVTLERFLSIPIPLQPKAASSRLPWLCLRIWERRECLGYWVWGTPYGPHLCTCLSQALLPVCFVFLWPSRVFSAPSSVSPHLCSLTGVLVFLQSLSPVNVQLYSTLCPLSTVLFLCSCSNENVHKEFKKALER